MKIILTNLSNYLYESSRTRLNESAKRFGIIEINSYDFEDIKKTQFYFDNKEILDQPRGIGYWLWKPYIVLETMKKLSDGDIVIYSDSGIEITENPEPLLHICKNLQPVVLFANGNLVNFTWTKRDCFILMDCDKEKFWYSPQCDAAFSLFRKSDTSIRFLNDWLQYSADKRIITDIPNTCGKKNLIGYYEHRWDQSVLSLLAMKYNIPLYRMPTQYGNHYKSQPYRVAGEFNCISQFNLQQVKYYAKDPFNNSPYYQLLNHHRSKNNNAGKTSKASVAKKIERRIRLLFYKLALVIDYNKIKKFNKRS